MAEDPSSSSQAMMPSDDQSTRSGTPDTEMTYDEEPVRKSFISKHQWLTSVIDSPSSCTHSTQRGRTSSSKGCYKNAFTFGTCNLTDIWQGSHDSSTSFGMGSQGRHRAAATPGLTTDSHTMNMQQRSRESSVASGVRSIPPRLGMSTPGPPPSDNQQHSRESSVASGQGTRVPRTAIATTSGRSPWYESPGSGTAGATAGLVSCSALKPVLTQNGLTYTRYSKVQSIGAHRLTSLAHRDPTDSKEVGWHHAP